MDLFSIAFFEPDRVVVSNYPANIPVALYKLFRPNTKVVWICNEVPALLSEKKSRLWQQIFRVEKFLSLSFERIIANSKNTKNEIMKHYGKCTDVVYSGVEIYEPKDPKLSEHVSEAMSAPYLFCLSRIHRHKNIEFLQEIASHFPQFKILVAGKGPDVMLLDQMKAKFSNIFYLGAVSEDEKFSLYREARAFLFLPHQEPLGVTVMESLTQNTPVVAFNSGGPKETILAGRNGALANSNKEFLAHAENWSTKKISDEFGIEYIRKDFSNRRMVNDFKNLVYQVN